MSDPVKTWLHPDLANPKKPDTTGTIAHELLAQAVCKWVGDHPYANPDGLVVVIHPAMYRRLQEEDLNFPDHRMNAADLPDVIRRCRDIEFRLKAGIAVAVDHYAPTEESLAVMEAQSLENIAQVLCTI